MASLKGVEYIDSKVFLAWFDLHNVGTMDNYQVIVGIERYQWHTCPYISFQEMV